MTVANSTEPGVVPWLVGDDQQIFEKLGVAIDEIIAGQGGSTTLRNLVSGGLEVADVGFPAVVDGTLTGTPVTAIAGSTRSAYGLDFCTLATSDIRTPADVRRWAFTNPKSVTETPSYLIPKGPASTRPPSSTWPRVAPARGSRCWSPVRSTSRWCRRPLPRRSRAGTASSPPPPTTSRPSSRAFSQSATTTWPRTLPSWPGWSPVPGVGGVDPSESW